MYGEAVALTDQEGIARICDARLGVKGDAAGGLGDDGFTITLRPQSRATCLVDGEPLPCDQLPTDAPLRFAEGDGPWRLTRPAPRRIASFAGPLCTDGDHWTLCKTRWVRYVDEAGEPAPTFTEMGLPSLRGRLRVAPGPAPALTDPMLISERGKKVVVVAHPRSGEANPEPTYRDWKVVDWAARVHAALETASMEVAELEPFTGGAYLLASDGELLGIIAFASPRRAAISTGRGIQQVEVSP